MDGPLLLPSLLPGEPGESVEDSDSTGAIRLLRLLTSSGGGEPTGPSERVLLLGMRQLAFAHAGERASAAGELELTESPIATIRCAAKMSGLQNMEHNEKLEN